MSKDAGQRKAIRKFTSNAVVRVANLTGAQIQSLHRLIIVIIMVFFLVRMMVLVFISVAIFIPIVLSTQKNLIYFIISFIHSDHFYSASSSPPLLRSAPA